MLDPLYAPIACACIAAFGVWAGLATCVTWACVKRARAAEARLAEQRARKSGAVAQGNRTRAAQRRALSDKTTAQLRLAIEARAAAPTPEESK
ncbi:MAG TPA: hypothetical protein VN222_02835 [Novosphingobium sp.]|nr:hypothetical protein [Novosphingobium sp.]